MGADNCLASGFLQFNNGNAVIEAYGAARAVPNDLHFNNNFRIAGSQDLNFTSTTSVTTGGRTVYVDNTGKTTMATPWAQNGNMTFNMGDGSGDFEVTGVVTITGGNRNIKVTNASDTAGVTIYSGGIAQDGTPRNITKQGTGTLVVTGSSTYTGLTYVNDYGTLRATDGAGLPTASRLVLNNGVFESSGTFTRTIGNVAGTYVQWNNAGGFSAYGGALDVTLSGGATINWAAGSASGFNNKILLSGSYLSDNVVTLTNNIELRGNREVRVYDNPNSTADYTVLSGTISDGDTSARQLTKTEAGTLVLAGVNTYTGNTNINAGTLKVTGSIDSSTAIVKTGTFLTGDGSVKAITAQTGGTVAPGDGVGALAAVAGNVSFAATSTYEWELGAADNDTIDVTGNVTLTDGWILKLVDAGGIVDALTEYDLFTTTGSITLGAGTIDGSGVDWDTSVQASCPTPLAFTSSDWPSRPARQRFPSRQQRLFLLRGDGAVRRRRSSGAAEAIVNLVWHFHQS